MKPTVFEEFVSRHRLVKTTVGLSIMAWVYLKPVLKVAFFSLLAHHRRYTRWLIIAFVSWFLYSHFLAGLDSVLRAIARFPEVPPQAVWGIFAASAFLLCAAAFLSVLAAGLLAILRVLSAKSTAHPPLYLGSVNSARVVEDQPQPEFVKQESQPFTVKSGGSAFTPSSDEIAASNEQLLMNLRKGIDLEKLRETGVGLDI